MKKYRLKKDLPFAKAGVILSFTNFGRDELQDLISEGWIEEEVKPREFWINIHSSGSNYIEVTQDKVELTRWAFGRDNEIIKVREIED